MKSEPKPRWRFLPFAVFLVALAVLIAYRIYLRPGSSSAPTVDVVLITMDTTRADHLGCYGATRVRTPALDALAARGVRVTDAETPVPLTLPAHATILTGAYPPCHGVRHNGMFRLPSASETLAEALRRRGYATGAVIAATTLDSQFGLSQGFDSYDEDLSGGHEIPDIKVKERRAEEVTRRALRFVRLAGDKRFFLWAHYFDPHTDYAPPPPFADEYATDLYAGEIAYMDREIGRLVEGIEKARGSDALILWAVAADHGEGLGEHGEPTHGLFLYESTVRVPLIFALPSVLPTGVACDEPADLADVTPTILDLLGSSPLRSAQGRSLTVELKSAAVTGAASERARDASPSGGPGARYLETYYPYFGFGWNAVTALRSGRFKYIEAPCPELYDLAADPGEQTNLALSTERSAVEVALAEELDRKRSMLECATPFSFTDGRLRPQLTERIQALGYAAASAEERKRSDDSLIPRDPKDLSEVWDDVRLAERLFDGGDLDGGMDAIRRALAKRPASLYAHHILAAEYRKRRIFHLAVTEYRVILERNPRDAAAYLGLAQSEIGLGLASQALESLERASAFAGDRAALRRMIGLAFAELGASTQATAELDRVLARNPRDARALCGLGSARQILGDRRGAIQAYERALSVEPTFREALVGLGRLYFDAGRFKEAIPKLKGAIQGGPPDATLLSLLGAALLETGDRPGATTYIGQALSVDADCGFAHLYQGELRARESKFGKAIEEYRRAVALRGDSEALAALALAEALTSRAPTSLRNPAEAAALARRALELRPSDPRAYLALAWAELARGNADEASRAAERGLALEPSDRAPFQEVLKHAGGRRESDGR